jgi:hypothetical protein
MQVAEMSLNLTPAKTITGARDLLKGLIKHIIIDDYPPRADTIWILKLFL